MRVWQKFSVLPTQQPLRQPTGDDSPVPCPSPQQCAASCPGGAQPGRPMWWLRCEACTTSLPTCSEELCTLFPGGTGPAARRLRVGRAVQGDAFWDDVLQVFDARVSVLREHFEVRADQHEGGFKLAIRVLAGVRRKDAGDAMDSATVRLNGVLLKQEQDVPLQPGDVITLSSASCSPDAGTDRLPHPALSFHVGIAPWASPSASKKCVQESASFGRCLDTPAGIRSGPAVSSSKIPASIVHGYAAALNNSLELHNTLTCAPKAERRGTRRRARSFESPNVFSITKKVTTGRRRSHSAGLMRTLQSSLASPIAKDSVPISPRTDLTSAERQSFTLASQQTFAIEAEAASESGSPSEAGGLATQHAEQEETVRIQIGSLPSPFFLECIASHGMSEAEIASLHPSQRELRADCSNAELRIGQAMQGEAFWAQLLASDNQRSTISPEHAEVMTLEDDARICLRSLGDSITFLNGLRVHESAWVKHGDMIGLGVGEETDQPALTFGVVMPNGSDAHVADTSDNVDTVAVIGIPMTRLQQRNPHRGNPMSAALAEVRGERSAQDMHDSLFLSLVDPSQRVLIESVALAAAHQCRTSVCTIS